MYKVWLLHDTPIKFSHHSYYNISTIYYLKLIIRAYFELSQSSVQTQMLG